jgi:hypothetical protein
LVPIREDFGGNAEFLRNLADQDCDPEPGRAASFDGQGRDDLLPLARY